MVGEDTYLEAEIDELNDLLGDEGPPPEPQPAPEPEPQPEPDNGDPGPWGYDDDTPFGGDRDADEDEDDRPSRRPFRLRRPAMAAVAVILIAGVVAAALLFTHTLPGPGTVPPSSIVTSGCGDSATLTPTPDGGIVEGTSGIVLWSCGTLSSPAFTVHSAGSVTPTFTDPSSSGFTTLYIYKISSGAPTTDCASAGTYIVPSSGIPVIFTPGDEGDWNYCADYSSAPAGGFDPMTVAWSQP